MKANLEKELPKTKEEKLLELRFWFQSNGKKYKDFREDNVYRAILEAIDRLGYQDFLPIDIIQDMDDHNSKVLEKLRSENFAERSIGSRLKQLKLRSILEIKGEKPQVRQKVFGIDKDVESQIKTYIRKLLEINKG